MLTNTQMLLLEATYPLTREAEQDLFKSLHQAKIDVEALKQIQQRTLNQSSQLGAANRRVKQFKTQIVSANLPLIISVAKYFECPGISEEQFVSEGVLKLLQCIDAFDVRRGFKFSTYLQRPLYRHFNRFIKKEVERNRDRIDSELVFNILVIDDSESHEADELVEVLANNTAGLDAMEKAMLLHYYGIGQPAPKTLKQLGIHFGLSTGRLKKTLARAIDKLKNVLIVEDTNVSE